MKKPSQAAINATILVAALGYFVDIYDLVLFSIVRVPSLQSLGVGAYRLLEDGVFLLNAQMIGMLLGGIIWGVWADKRGRLSVLFGSIALYSIANIANAFVTNIEQYGLLRFLAGVGLAGELGAAITLISEIMPSETRGYGTTVVAAVGVSGAVVAALIGDAFSWKVAYIVGGALGLVLLALRIRMAESHLFHSSSSEVAIRKGDLRLLLGTGPRLIKYIHCILIGVPIWFVIGILITFSPEFAKELGVDGAVTGGRAIMMAYIGLVLGDIASGLGSQWLRSRKKMIGSFVVLTFSFILFYLNARGVSSSALYGLCLGMGFGTGYWAVFVTTASEQFGTNLRATVTTTAPNFVRGAVVPLTLSFQWMRAQWGILISAHVLAIFCCAVALLSLRRLQESFGKNLDYYEY